MTRTKAGLVMRATQVDRMTAQAFGINVDRVYMGTFALGAGLAALAGVLIVPIQQAHYLMGHDPLLLSFIVVIIGGLGSLARHPGGRAGHRAVRRRDLDVLHAHAGQDPRHAPCRDGPGLPPAGPVRSKGVKVWTLHLALLAVLFTAQFWLSPYHATNLARIMVLAVFAMGYNLAFGYTGLLSLGHALLLAAGMYAAGLPAQLWGWTAGPALSPGSPEAASWPRPWDFSRCGPQA
jgi:ABC-type branched-subunit amino acid transport system permease subunit